jgi:CHASE2 domain-containing sensor protein
VRFNVWRDVRQRTKVLREIVVPGAVILGLIFMLRLSGLLQVQEWMAFDSFSRSCPSEQGNSSVVVVGIDEADLSHVGGYPIPDRDLAIALKNLQAYHPSVIGLDLFRDTPVEPGHAELVEALQTMPNLIGTEVALNAKPTLNIKPPSSLPPERVGFVDAVVDADGKLRRSLLVSSTSDGEMKYSLTFRLAQTHLAKHGVTFNLGDRLSAPLRFGTAELPRFQSNSGGYVQADAKGNQLLLNFCGTQKMVRSLSLKDVLENNVPPDWIRDRVVMIGMTASSIKDIFFTAALREPLNARLSEAQMSVNQIQMPANQVIYGVEAHAYTVHQIIDAVLTHHPLIISWAEPWEYLWIGAWGVGGLALGIVLQSPWKSLTSLAISSLVLMMLCHMLLQVMGWWLPLVPTLLALCGCGLSASFFDRNLRFELEYRRLAIERTYEAVHNGPLQHLAVILRSLGEENHSSARLEQQLWLLNEELRRIFEYMRQEVSKKYTRLYLRGDLVLDLKAPISELLYQVYNHTRAEKLPGLDTIRTFVPPNFAPLTLRRYRLEQKRGLCLFLHEALFNVGKHANGATRLDVMCAVEAGWFVLRIIDNGSGLNPGSGRPNEGQGTLQAREIARELRGHFSRRSNNPQGTICELIWRRRSRWRGLLKARGLPKSASPLP